MVSQSPQAKSRKRNMVHVPSNLYEALGSLAERNRRPLSWELALAVEEHLRAYGCHPDEQTRED